MHISTTQKVYKVCQNCAHVNYSRASFCANCGSAVGELAATDARGIVGWVPPDDLRTQQVCPKCTVPNPMYAHHCIGCGTQLPKDTLPAADPRATTGAVAPLAKLIADDPSLANGVRAAVEQELSEIADWASRNARDATRDQAAFWSLKAPAIVCSACSAAFEALGWGVPVIVMGLISAICVAVDGAYPRGRLHNAHKRASHDLHQLHHDVRSAFTQSRLRGEDPDVAVDILEMARMRRSAVTNYLRAAEASLGSDSVAQSGRDSAYEAGSKS